MAKTDADPRAIADYLVEFIPELAGLAEQVGHDALGYLLRMAETEARQISYHLHQE